jgi:hypothetical protein
MANQFIGLLRLAWERESFIGPVIHAIYGTIIFLFFFALYFSENWTQIFPEYLRPTEAALPYVGSLLYSAYAALINTTSLLLFIAIILCLTSFAFEFTRVCYYYDNCSWEAPKIIIASVNSLYENTIEKIIESATQAFPNPLIEEMMKTNTKFKLKSSILLAGFDGNKAILSEISERTYADFRDMNFHAIGSGSIQAVNTLMFQKHDKNDSLSATIYDVYKAKRNAEVAQGVGKETELIVLTKGKGYKTLTGESFKALKDIYDEEVKVGRNHPTLKKLKFGGRGGPCS